MRLNNRYIRYSRLRLNQSNYLVKTPRQPGSSYVYKDKYQALPPIDGKQFPPVYCGVNR
jgi:hypothetical protein